MPSSLGSSRRQVSFPQAPTLVALALCLVGATACSSNSPGGTGGSGGNGGAGGTDGSGTGDGGMVTAGEVSFTSGGPTGGLGMAGAYTMIAIFDQGSGHLDGTPPCEAPVDGCTLCTTSSAGGGTTMGDLDVTFVSAGTVTFDDGATQLASLDFDMANGDYEYDSNTHPSLTWSPGDTMKATATGGTIPAFSASITAPHYITATSPTFSLENPMQASTSAPFVMSWTPSSDNGSMKLLLSHATTKMSVSCIADESAGKVTVPASLLAKLEAGTDLDISLAKTVSKAVPVEGAEVMITAATPQLFGLLTLK